MAFTEELKRAVRRHSDLRCCVCRSIGVDIHHIVPQAEGGSDTEDNAAPLCPSCHEMLGGNPSKRKFIREARDNWYDTCDRRFASEAKLDQLVQVATHAVTRDDLASFRSDLLNAVATIVNSERERPRTRTLGEIVQHLYDFSIAGAKNGRQQANWLYEFTWGRSLGDDEYDEIKNEFVEWFGKETARRLCHYALQKHPYDILSSDGFTDEEIGGLVNRVMIASIMLLHHVDLVGSDNGLLLGIDPDGAIRGWAAENAPIPAGGTPRPGPNNTLEPTA